METDLRLHLKAAFFKLNHNQYCGTLTFMRTLGYLLMCWSIAEQSHAVQACKMDLGRVLQSARMVPGHCQADKNAFKEGRCGWLMKEIEPGSFYELIGLKKGDLILEVNGKRIKSPAPFIEEFFEFKSQESKKLLIDRDGKKEEITYSCPY